MAVKIVTPVALVASMFGFIGLQVYQSAPANALDMQYVNIGTHPRASALIGTDYDYYGPRLHDMAVSNGKLYAGYGDWNSNSDSWGPAAGRVALVPFDIASKTFESQDEVMVGSEAINTIREINGALYVPSTDPSIHGSGGYATNVSGSWEVRNVIPDAVHIFDAATLTGTDLWMFGARDNYPPFDGSVGRAVAWRSTDGGQTWGEALSQGSEPGQGAGFERYYWGQKAGDKLFMHAAGTVPELPTQSYDGSITASHPNVTCGGNGHRVIEFEDKIVCPNSYINGNYFDLIAIDSQGNGTSANYGGGGYIEDFYVHNGYLYALENDGTVQRTNDLQTWTALGTWAYPGEDYVTATSLVVYNDKIYIGDSRSNIYESGTTITAELARSGLDTCFIFDGNGTITGYYDNENDNPQNPECSRNVQIPNEIDGEPVTGIGQYAFDSRDIESVTLPSGVTSIGRYAFSNNSLVSAQLPSTLQTLGYGAFSNNQLTSIHLPESLTSMQAQAFNRNKLTSVVIPSSITEISDETFFDNELTSVTIPSGVTSIGFYAFAGNKLTTVNIPAGLTSLSDGAFEYNNLRTVTLPNGLTEISPYVFAGNELRQVNIPNSVTSIDRTAFIEQTEMLPFEMPDDGEGDSLRALSTEAGVPSTLIQYLDSIWYVRLYTQDPSNPNNLTSDAWVTHIDETTCSQSEVDSLDTRGNVTTQNCGGTNYQSLCAGAPAYNDDSAGVRSTCEGDINGDGDADDIFDANYGGHLINPAFVALLSETTKGEELADPRTLTGKDGDRYVEGYMVKDGPALQPSPDDKHRPQSH